MTINVRGIRCGILGAFLAACGASGVALADDEVEPNYPEAQPLVRGAYGTMSVKGVIGVSELWNPAVNDVDLYSFFARKDDVLNIDIDFGIKTSSFVVRSVDTSLSLLGPGPDYKLHRQDRYCLAGRMGNSVDNQDACILNFKAPADGIYTVAVTGDPALVYDGRRVDWGGKTSSNGSYTLNVSGASEMQSVIQINIEIKPGSGTYAPINPKARGIVPVALLSSKDFDPMKVDVESLTFGATGDEPSWSRCTPQAVDLNGDGMPDRVCHFSNELAEFGPDSPEGVLKGTITIDGNNIKFEGHGLLKVVPAKK